MFYEKLSTLCTKRGKSIAAVNKELGFSTGTSTKWKNGSIPNTKQLILLASYFDCSIDYLLGIEKEEVEPEVKYDIMLNEETIEIVNTYNEMDFKQRARLVAYMLELGGK